MPVVPFIPLIVSGVQAAAARSSQQNLNAKPFDYIPPSPGERLANQFQKGTWKGLVSKYTGAPEPVLQKYGAMKTAQATADAMGAGAVPGGGRYAGETQATLANQQDPTAQGVNAATGQALHNWAMAGKIKQGQERQAFNAEIAKMQLAYKLNQMDAMRAANERTQAAVAAVGKAGMGALGNWLGNRTAPTPSTPSPTLPDIPHTELPQPTFGQSPLWGGQPNIGAGTTPSWTDWMSTAFGPTDFKRNY